MTERLPVEIVFDGVPFDRAAVIHTLRHLAMRVGWVLSPKADHRLRYITEREEITCLETTTRDIVVLSSPAVGQHLRTSMAPIPLARASDGRLLPFPHPEATHYTRPGWITGDVLAGAYAVLNLWYERRTRPLSQEGWMCFADDWWLQSGLPDPQPLADAWLDRLVAAAAQMGWPCPLLQQGGTWGHTPGTLVLTHDVDYLPTSWNLGVPRLMRALVRQTVTRQRPGDALRVLARYTQALSHSMPYFELPTITRREGEWGVRSSFQVTVAHHHRADPAYHVSHRPIAAALRRLHAEDWEVCLHGSYTASRTPGRLGEERAILEQVLGRAVLGHRQHYLHFHPAQLFSEVERASFAYDSSVGYNDCSGPRAGTLWPYRPYNIEHGRPHTFWEIPFVLMDTTLATTYRLSGQAAWEHVLAVLRQYHGCVAVIWHQEQLGGLLDPGFDDVYYQLLAWAQQAGIRLVSGRTLLPDLDAAWAATVCDAGMTR
jgi:hypothetical protein